MSAFVDQARTVTFPQATARVEGRLVPSGAPVYGPWFRCYYDPGDEGEAANDGGFRRRRSASLIARSRAKDGSTVTLKGNDVVEIVSRRHGTMTMNIVGTPKRLTKTRSAFGIEAQLGKTNRTTST